MKSKAHKPERTCVICRQRFEKGALTRHVLGPDGILKCDERKVLPGRGWYVCTNSTCVAKFAKFRPGKKAGRKGKESQGAI